MAAPGREYNVEAKRYIEAPALAAAAARAAAADRPWRRLEGEPKEAEASMPSLHTDEDKTIYYYSGKEARDTSDVTAKDYSMAVSHFSEAATGIRGQGAAGRSALDLGCGDALMARRLVRSGKFDLVFGVDCSRKQLESGRQAAEAERLWPEDGLFLLRADAQALPFKEAQVDCVWWGQGLHVVQDPSVALASVLAALKPGGRLLATTRVEQFTAEEIAKLAKGAGFVEVAVKVPRYAVYTLFAAKPL